MAAEELVAQVRMLRGQGCSPKEIARALGVRPAVVAPLVKALAAQDESEAPDKRLVGCWVSPGWSAGLTVDGRHDWPDVAGTDPGASGLAGVVVAREHRHGRVSACGYLVDVYCLGVKDAMGPRVMDERRLPDFTGMFFSAFGVAPLPAPLDLAQHLVLGAVEYARTLGFEPHRDFAATAGHLGGWAGPSAIRFGLDGKPFYVQGPYDDPNRILATLHRSTGLDHDVLVLA